MKNLVAVTCQPGYISVNPSDINDYSSKLQCFIVGQELDPRCRDVHRGMTGEELANKIEADAQIIPTLARLLKKFTDFMGLTEETEVCIPAPKLGRPLGNPLYWQFDRTCTRRLNEGEFDAKAKTLEECLRKSMGQGSTP